MEEHAGIFPPCNSKLWRVFSDLVLDNLPLLFVLNAIWSKKKKCSSRYRQRRPPDFSTMVFPPIKPVYNLSLKIDFPKILSAPHTNPLYGFKCHTILCTTAEFHFLFVCLFLYLFETGPQIQIFTDLLWMAMVHVNCDQWHLL